MIEPDDRDTGVQELMDFFHRNEARYPAQRYERSIDVIVEERVLDATTTKKPEERPAIKPDDPTAITGGGGIGGIGGGGPPGGFSLSASPTSLSTLVGTPSSPSTITLNRGSNFNDAVIFTSISGLPSGGSHSFGSGVNGWSAGSSLPKPQVTFGLGNAGQTGTYTAILTFKSTTNPNVSATVNITVTFTGAPPPPPPPPPPGTDTHPFQLTASPATVSAALGVTSNPSTINLTRDAGFTSQIVFDSITGLPSGASHAFDSTTNGGWLPGATTPSPKITFGLGNAGQRGNYTAVVKFKSASNATQNQTVSIGVNFT